jgi:hypothetical protein
MNAKTPRTAQRRQNLNVIFFFLGVLASWRSSHVF